MLLYLFLLELQRQTITDLKYTAELGECFKVVDMDDKWPKSVIQVCTKTFKCLTATTYNAQISCENSTRR